MCCNFSAVIREGYQSDRREIEREHQPEECPRLPPRSGEFPPCQHAPKRSDHRRRLPDGI